MPPHRTEAPFHEAIQWADVSAGVSEMARRACPRQGRLMPRSTMRRASPSSRASQDLGIAAGGVVGGNCDIVLRDPSVSKLHADFCLADALTPRAVFERGPPSSAPLSTLRRPQLTRHRSLEKAAATRPDRYDAGALACRLGGREPARAVFLAAGLSRVRRRRRTGSVQGAAHARRGALGAGPIGRGDDGVARGTRSGNPQRL